LGEKKEIPLSWSSFFFLLDLSFVQAGFNGMT